MSETSGRWLNRKEAADFLTRGGCPLSPRSLTTMAMHDNAGGGPPFTRTKARIVRYHMDDLRVWAAQNARRVA